MGKKKKNRSGSVAAGPFKNNPFRQLKGFVVPEEEARPAAPKTPSVPAGSEDAEVDFLTAMAGLGVERIDDGAEDSLPLEQMRTKSDSPVVEDEQQLFLEALGSLDVRFEDGTVESPEEDALPAANPRRIKQLVRGKLRIEARLDLHGCTRDEALEKFEHFILNARHQGWTVLLVITGKGHHSQEGPVLREAIERRLRLKRPDGLLEWQRAPRQFGGDGALVLFFRSPAGI